MFRNTSLELSRSLHIPISLNEGFTRSMLNCCCLEVRSTDKFFWSMLFNNIMLLGNIKAMARNMTKMLYLRFHDKISDNIQYLYGIIIHFANIFNIQNSLQQPPWLNNPRPPPSLLATKTDDLPLFKLENCSSSSLVNRNNLMLAGWPGAKYNLIYINTIIHGY